MKKLLDDRDREINDFLMDFQVRMDALDSITKEALESFENVMDEVEDNVNGGSSSSSNGGKDFEIHIVFV